MLPDEVDYDDAQRSARRAWYIRFTAIFVVSCLLIACLFAFLHFNTGIESNSVQRLYTWDYTYKNKLKNINSNSAAWHTSDEANPIKIDDGSEYLFLRTRLSETNSYDTLCIRSANAVMTVLVDDEIVYDTLDETNQFSSNKVNVIPLGEYDSGQLLEITMYTPLTFSFDAFLTDAKTAAICAAPFPYFDVIIGSIFVVTGILILLFSTYILKNANIKKLTVYLLSALCASCGLVIFLNPVYTYFGFGASLVTLKFSMFLSVLVPGLALSIICVEKMQWNKYVEGFVGLNILYALCVMFSPYNMLLMMLLKMCCLVQIVNLIVFYVFKRKYELTLDPMSEGVYMAFAVTNILYWYCVSEGLAFDFSLPVLMATWMFALTAYVAWVPAARRGGSLEEDGEVRGTLVKSAHPPLSLVRPSEKSYSLHEAEHVPAMNPSADNILVFNEVTHIFDFSETIKRVIASKCDGGSNHLIHVAEYVKILCLKMGMSKERTMFIARASLLHDIGKISIPYDVLLKSDALSEDEFTEIRKHTIYGYNILNGNFNEFLDMAAQIAREHHERFDGSGYIGLKGGDINFYARIVAVADVFDALTTERTYKKGWVFEQGFSYIVEHGGDFFDPEVTEVFASCYDDILKAYNSFKNDTYVEPASLWQAN